MEGSIERALLTRLEAGFHQQTGSEANATRQVSAYISDLSRKLEDRPDAVIQIPDEITGLRRHYLEVVRANSQAKIQHAHALKRTENGRPNLDGSSESTSLLGARIDQLFREKQHSSVDIIDHYVRELDRDPNQSVTIISDCTKDEALSPKAPGSNITGITRDVKDKLQSLEMAVLQARHRANREKVQLQSVKVSARVTDESDGGDQLRALEIVKSDLTRWLEDILVKCSLEDTPERPFEGIGEQKLESTSDDVRQAYQKYVEARKKLVGLVQTASSIEPSPNPGLGPVELNASKTVPQVDDQVIEHEQEASTLESKQSLEQSASYLDSVLKEERAESIELLQRLADESQLLSMYPILARSEKFNNAVRTFGSKDASLTVDEIIARMEGWAFAAGAADDMRDGTIAKHLKQGHQGMAEVQTNVGDMAFLKATAGEG